MKKILIAALIVANANAKWEMFIEPSGHTYIYDTDSGKVARYFRNKDDKDNVTGEGFMPLFYSGNVYKCDNDGVISDVVPTRMYTYDEAKKTFQDSLAACQKDSKKK